MTKYYVLVTYDASVTYEIEADSPEEAKEKAMDEAGPVSLCHQCANHLEVGDPMKAHEPWTDEPSESEGESPCQSS